MPIRIMQFDIDPQQVRDSMLSFAGGMGLSMTLPYLEPYLIRTMRESLKHVTDKSVEQEVRQFIGQEAQHYKQHKILNDIIRSTNSQLAGLQEIEDEMEADYQRFTSTKSLKFNLAYAEGFEAATCAIARNELQFSSFDRIPEMKNSELLRLFHWHLLEEVEHRTVTFNIYKHLYGDYFYRLAVGLFGQYHFFKYVGRFAVYISQNSPQGLQSESGASAAGAIKGQTTISESLSVLGSLLKTYLPWYDPAKLKIKSDLPAMSGQFSKQAKEIRLPD